jgi:protein-disulfide isomerase
MSKLKPAINSNDHIQGDPHAPIELLEFGDYQCPHCGRAYPIIKRVQQAMGSKLKFVFRNFPLAEIHPNATNAAIASEAASAQGKFWEMHDIIFEHQEHLGNSHLLKYAEKIGLDVAKFEKDFQSPAFLEKVEADFESGVRSGVNGTPSFFINGAKYNGNWEEVDLLEYLQALEG